MNIEIMDLKEDTYYKLSQSHYYIKTVSYVPNSTYVSVDVYRHTAAKGWTPENWTYEEHTPLAFDAEIAPDQLTVPRCPEEIANPKSKGNNQTISITITNNLRWVYQPISLPLQHIVFEGVDKITTETLGPPKCECGAEKCGSNFHSNWCPKCAT